jgi:hypothetical protein
MGLFKATINERTSNRAPVIHLFPVLVGFLSLLLLLTFIVLILSDLVGFRLGNTELHSNPFTAYEGIWPGQSIESVAAYARQTPEESMTCFSSSAPDPNYPGLVVHIEHAEMDELDRSIVCTQVPGDSVFRIVNVTIEDKHVQELQLGSNGLQEDSLLLYWGEPDAIIRIGNSQDFWLRWVHDMYWATAKVEPAQPGAIVRILTIAARK